MLQISPSQLFPISLPAATQGQPPFLGQVCSEHHIRGMLYSTVFCSNETYNKSMRAIQFPLYMNPGWCLWAAPSCGASTVKNLDFTEEVHISYLKELFLSLRHKGELYFIL